MFYSHTFLARKGPLGTVWLAAHLQHKLKKSHYTSTNIPSTVERIMFPEVPIALRMSGHLLLGVVRIYSKKVDYLHHDCNSLWVSLRNAFRPVDVNLQENATEAPFNAVTLPETYQLDSLDIDVALSLDDMLLDKHLKTHEEITLTDEYTGGELYVRITFDDDITPELSRSGASPPREIDPMQIDGSNPPQEPVPASRGDGDEGSVPRRESVDRNERFEEGSSLPDIPELETLRDWHGDDNQTLLPEGFRSPQQNIPEKEAGTSPREHATTPPVVRSPQSSERSGPSSPPRDGFPGPLDDPFANITTPEMTLRSTPPLEKPLSPPELRLRSSPPPEKPLSPEQRPQRRRKKRQFFDESLVLTNQFLKNALDNTSDVVKKRKKLPSTALDMWRSTNKRKKEHIFSETVISGLCAELQSVSNKDIISIKTNLVLPENIPSESGVAESPPRDMEIERLRSADIDAGQNLTHEILLPTPQFTQYSQQEMQTTSPRRILESVSEAQFGTAFGSESDRGMFTGSTDLGLETPLSDFREQIDGSNIALSDIPEYGELDELSFLDQDNNTPPDATPGPRETDSMSARTRAVAQYLQNHSPMSKDPGASDEISLSSILEGKTRKLCARMFYETLVLKNKGLIDVKQDEPYGDITLKLTQLTKAKI